MDLPRKGILYSVLIYLGEHFVQLNYFVQCVDLSKRGTGILYSVLTYLGGWAVWVGLCIKITPDLPKI
jgi:hypothetical protein